MTSPSAALNSTSAPPLQITWRYCALYFYERSYESGGRIFELLFTLMVSRRQQRRRLARVPQLQAAEAPPRPRASPRLRRVGVEHGAAASCMPRDMAIYPRCAREPALCPPPGQVWTMSFFSIFTSLVLAAKKAYTAALIALITQQIGLLLYHK